MPKQIFLISIIILSLVVFSSARAWTEPTCDPDVDPGLCNVPAPLNTGSTAQTKSGELTIKSFLYGDDIRLGNWGISGGVTAAGDIQVKDSTGTKTLFHINGATGNVGIGTPALGARLTVDGSSMGINEWAADIKVNDAWDNEGGLYIHYDPANGHDDKYLLRTYSAEFGNGLLVNTQGKVGIKTMSPAQALDVAGNIKGLTIGANEYCINPSGGCITSWPASGAATFLALTDTPSSFIGQLGKVVKVNALGTALEFADSQVGTVNSGQSCVGDAANVIQCNQPAPVGGVTSVSNTDSTLTVSPTTGAVVASLNLAKANTWTGVQEFSVNTNFPGSGIWNSAGNVGIGTVSPTSNLEIVGDSGIELSGSNFDNAFNIYRNVGDGLLDIKGNQVTNTGFRFSTLDSGEVVRITNTGNVGIGQTNPSAKLAVGGAGSAGDGIAVYTNLANTSALYAEQGSPGGYAGRFGGTGKVWVGSLSNPTGCSRIFTDINSGELRCGTETDPQVGNITTSGKWCTTDGAVINCASDAPVDTVNDSVDSSELDNICAINDKMLKRVAGVWQCVDPPSGSISGAGTDNYIPRWNGANALENSIIYDDGANVRIRVGGTANTGFDYSKNTGDFYLGGDNGQAGNLYVKDSAGALKVAINSDTSSYFTGGNVGIGTTVSDVPLVVKSSGSGAVIKMWDSSWADNEQAGFGIYGAAIGSELGGLYFRYHIDGTSASGLQLRAGGGDRMTVLSGGNVGIGMPNPSEKLEIEPAGKIKIGNGLIYWDGTKMVIEVVP